ncbi:GGDEF domain-containing protein [Sphingobium sp. Sx8-8]|uniref:GGDEF domain-containing protein n=1 Tax=Sphingobium sp. Sx8-8 TaxID=2933617 RepID=UPI001F5A8EFB|nr:GGDEF domain-containing protein [Sphingobium sp. Sx8-8]
MGEWAVREEQAVAREALKFLQLQSLAPSPQNYALGYVLKSGTNQSLASAVNDATDGGIRMSQKQADEIFTRCIGSLGDAGGGNAADLLRNQTRHQLLRMAEVATHAAERTGDFNRELSAGYEKLADKGLPEIDLIISDMVERSLRAEQDLAAAAREVEALRQELDTARHDANLDALTGLPNRRALETAMDRLRDEKRPFLVAICDVDHFKRVNDRYGHAVGDRVLKTVAASLVESCGGQMVGRWGGEEFLLVLQGLAPDEAEHLVDGARRDLGQRAFKLRESDEPMGAITFSAGLAVVSAGAAEWSSALDSADAALYRAKGQGRNMVLRA